MMFLTAPDISMAQSTWLHPAALIRTASAAGPPWSNIGVLALLDFVQSRDVQAEVNSALRWGALGEIGALGRLGENWDGYGALPIDQITIENARNFIQRLSPRLPLPEISPNPNGTISMEWTSSGALAHLEFGLTKFSFFLKKSVASPILREGDANNAWIIASLIEHEMLPYRPASQTINSIRMGLAPA